MKTNFLELIGKSFKLFGDFERRVVFSIENTYTCSNVMYNVLSVLDSLNN